MQPEPNRVSRSERETKPPLPKTLDMAALRRRRWRERLSAVPVRTASLSVRASLLDAPPLLGKLRALVCSGMGQAVGKGEEATDREREPITSTLTGQWLRVVFEGQARAQSASTTAGRTARLRGASDATAAESPAHFASEPPHRAVPKGDTSHTPCMRNTTWNIHAAGEGCNTDFSSSLLAVRSSLLAVRCSLLLPPQPLSEFSAFVTHRLHTAQQQC
eukprot:366546-Chlamydomonas_euryale.AAC.26